MMILQAPQHCQRAIEIVRLSIIISYVIIFSYAITPVRLNLSTEKVDDGCSLRHEVLDVTVCAEDVSCDVPLHKTAVLMCSDQSGKWVHSNSTVPLGTSSNLTLTRVNFSDSGNYHYDSKDPCNFIVSVGEPPLVTAPQLVHDHGSDCYTLPRFSTASTDPSFKVICNTTSEHIKWYMSNSNNMNYVPATGLNNKQVYNLPLFYGKGNTTEMFTCVVTNGYGNTTLTYVIDITQSPTDDFSTYEEASTENQEVNCTEGKDVMLSYEMNYYKSFSLAKFCFFPKGSYNPLFKFLDLDNSTCCVCVTTGCEKCNDITKWTISLTKDFVALTYTFTLLLKNVTPNDYGLYTMTACVFQVDNDSCGSPAWTEIKMCNHPHPSQDHDIVMKYILPSIGALVFAVLLVVTVIITFFCCRCWKRNKRRYKPRSSLITGSNDETVDGTDTTSYYEILDGTNTRSNHETVDGANTRSNDETVQGSQYCNERLPCQDHDEANITNANDTNNKHLVLQPEADKTSKNVSTLSEELSQSSSIPMSATVLNRDIQQIQGTTRGGEWMDTSAGPSRESNPSSFKASNEDQNNHKDNNGSIPINEVLSHLLDRSGQELMNAIRRSHPIIAEKIDFGTLIQYLNKYCIFTKGEINAFNNPVLMENNKVNNLIESLDKKEDKGIKDFIRALNDACEHSGHAVILQCIHEWLSSTI